MTPPICKNCNYNDDRGCAVNAPYWEASKRLEIDSQERLNLFSSVLIPCAEFEADEAMKPKTIELTLPLRTFQLALAKGLTHRENREALEELLTAIAQAVGIDQTKSSQPERFVIDDDALRTAQQQYLSRVTYDRQLGLRPSGMPPFGVRP